jgi:hypothetical protein
MKRGVIVEKDAETTSQVLDAVADADADATDRAEPDLDVHKISLARSP